MTKRNIFISHSEADSAAVEHAVEAVRQALASGNVREAQRALAAAAIKPKRNRKAEAASAKGNLAMRAATLKVARDADEMDELMQVAQALILCGLPYNPTDETRVVRKARLADGSEVRVTFSAALDGSKMPYGSDRTLLHFLIDKAVKTGSRFVSWNTAVEFLEQMGMQKASGKNYADLRKRFGRLRGLAIGVERTSAGVSRTMVHALIHRSALPSSMDVNAEKQGQQLLPLSEEVRYGVEFGEDFYTDLKKYHVPVPLQLFVETSGKSQLQDICLFLYWRCYAAQSESTIKWKDLRDQLWQADKTTRRIKVRFAEAIAFMREFWPELRAEARKDGLWVAPPLRGKQLLPKGKDARRLS